jgi:hypothetical protein
VKFQPNDIVDMFYPTGDPIRAKVITAGSYTAKIRVAPKDERWVPTNCLVKVKSINPKTAR